MPQKNKKINNFEEENILQVDPITLDPYGVLRYEDRWLWLITANFEHGMVVGGTGAGKTMLVRSMLYHLSRLGQVVILDPHIRFHWPLPTIGWCMNYPAISSSYKYLLEEMMYRFYVSNLEGYENYQHPHLYIIIDEAEAHQAKLDKEFTNFVKEITNQSRKINMHLILITHSDSVKSLGIEGEGQLRKNFTFVYYLEYAAKSFLPESEWELVDRKWPLIILYKGEYYAKHRNFVMDLIKEPINNDCVFDIPDLPSVDPKLVERFNKRLPKSQQIEIPETLQTEALIPSVVDSIDVDEMLQGVMHVTQHQSDNNYSISDFARSMKYFKGAKSTDLARAKTLLQKILDKIGVTIPAYQKLTVK